VTSTQPPGEATRTGAPMIRPMKLADLERVLQIELESYTMPWSGATFRSLLRRRDADLIVAECEGDLAGYAVSWYVVDQAELGNVAVAEPWRNRGIGSDLVAAMLELAERRNVREIFLEVRPSNPTAQRLYHRFGFRQVGRRTNYYSLPSEDALVMRRAIGSGPQEDA
jgi:[ribosomal protein S18]-alanine N-acetyltransferase